MAIIPLKEGINLGRIGPVIIKKAEDTRSGISDTSTLYSLF